MATKLRVKCQNEGASDVLVEEANKLPLYCNYTSNYQIDLLDSKSRIEDPVAGSRITRIMLTAVCVLS